MDNETRNRIRRLSAETMLLLPTDNDPVKWMAVRDALVAIISPEDYAKVQTQIEAVSTSPDEPEEKVALWSTLWNVFRG